MAPPASRRTGSNKKAQMGVFTGYVVAGIGALIGATLLIISIWRPETFSGIRTAASDVASPAGEIGAEARTEGRGIFAAIAGYYRAGSRNAELEREIRIARVKLAEAEAVEQENERLKAVLALSAGQTEPVAYARLIGGTSSSARRFAYLSAGRDDGVKPGMPVSSPMGLVGRVLEAGARSSRVLLLTDPESMIPVRRATDDVVAFAEGRADGSLRLRLVNLGINPIREGDVFVTSGAGGLFRPGTAVALATEITKDGAIARLLSNPAATDIVVVEPVWQPEAVRAVTMPDASDQAEGD
ncbi:rod shape-determining protein MreC [Altererythrobacter atlanticus]|uniref:Cell shape-determining protein MreC n=1 Tax=Croceibacterium atlanticum TaxID=1267766 RepID=A0A0F7KR14_9SPHN|nr:rod shape-determining protein MreC [Croceibacterium atlanticum]AKH41627.1 Cell shape-determining protein MreC [Croceibacterium atlanticum]MBB5733089.1 rod shape-determining protein MreC [Croceibacterium atlanticum]